MSILLEADPTTAAVLSGVLPTGAQVVSREDQVHQLLRSRTHYALVIGPTVTLAEAAGLSEQVSLAHPATTIILLRHDLAPEVYAYAMQSGIGAVLAAGDQTGLGTAVVRARQAWETLNGGVQDEHHQGRVFTVFSPKGGVGKTTMSVNLALALTAAGSRVCILDLDLAFGDVAITLQVIPGHTIADAAAGHEEDVDDALLQSLLTRHDSGLSILAAPTHPEGRDRISASLVRRIVQALRTTFDFVVIDTPPGFDDQVLGAFDETDECVIVVTLDVPTVKNAKVALETLDLLHLLPNNRHLVVNRADDEVGFSVANVESILNRKVSVSLPSSTAVASATNHGEPIVLAKPDHPVSRAVTALARELRGSAPEEISEPAKRGLFRRGKKQEIR